MIFDVKLQKTGKIIVILFSLIGTIITSVYEWDYSNLIILAMFISSLLIVIFSETIKNKQLSYIFTLPITLFFIDIIYSKFSQSYILFILPLQLFTITGLYFVFGESLFKIFYEKDMGGIKTHWKSLDNKSLEKLKGYIVYFPLFVLIFHIFLIILSINDVILLIHHLNISLIFIFLTYDTLKKAKSLKWEKEIARVCFHVIMLFIIFDILLAEWLIIKGQIIYVIYVYPMLLIGYLRVLFRPRI